ncbi:hypothetical protein FRC09_006862 [Ceratobasidium sp. 395]|nr:hypothetical protein FRC09_006862 [Ceratobasidium sp. 395]
MVRTSRLGFNTAASRIWRSLASIQPLLTLLAPTLELSESDVCDEEVDEEVVKVTLPSFGPGVFTRFNYYNNFVRKLEISNTWHFNALDSSPLQIESWSTLFLQAQHAPLLPNLEDLGISGFFLDENEAVLWISIFVSPSVKALNLRNFISILGYIGTAIMLYLLTQEASNAQRIPHDHVIVPRECAFVENPSVPRPVPPLTRDHLQNSQNLVHLAINGQFVNSAILLGLSCLPKLQFLSINQVVPPNETLTKAFQGISLPPESFRSLQEFRLSSTSLDDTVAVWNVVPLVSNLTAATLRYISRAEEPRIRTIYDDEVLLLILPLISTSSPNIKTLILDTMASADDEPLMMNLTNSPWIHTGHLSLSHLGLKQFNANATSFEDVQRVWPRLVVLDIPEQVLTLQHLVCLSQLPELKKSPPLD